MKSLFILLLGALCGVLGTVLFFTLDPGFEGDSADGAGGGNASITLDEEALATLIREQLPQIEGLDGETAVDVTIDPAGVLIVELTAGRLGVGVRSSATINPNIVDGRLQLDVVEARLGPVAVPDQLARLMEEPLQARLDALAAGLDYKLTSITTTDRRLTLEIRL